MPCIPELENSSVAESFNPDHSHYRCCFQNFHVQTGSVMIALSHVLCALTGLAAVLNTLIVDEQVDYAQCFIAIVALSASAVISIILIVGVRLEKKLFVTVYITAQTAFIIILFILFLLLILGYKRTILGNGVDAQEAKYTSTEEELRVVLEIFLSLGLTSLELWFLTVILRSYRYLKDKGAFTGNDRVEAV
ncbi:hypothetical protein Tcan_07604 [Toxocara canis]|uniref:Uncharacterized protein n=1 Tax=Toxocara canis TaxID=6265 RepID=A0A0B2VEG1_TOXCA|nr:hypothetical protein Tcan_07604 [Toxocara canis]